MKKTIIRIVFLLMILILFFKVNIVEATDLYLYADSEISVEDTVEINIKEVGVNKPFIKNRTTYKNFTWTSSNKNVLEITTEFINGPTQLQKNNPMEIVKMTGKKAGTATITARFEDWSTGKAVKRTVKKEVTVKGISLYGGNSIPNDDAGAKEIYNFMVRNSADITEQGDFSKLVDEERLEKWIDTLKKSQKADTTYKPVIKKLQKLLKSKKEGNTQTTDFSEEDKKILDTYQNNYKVKLEIDQDSGTERNNVVFVDVLDNVNNYIPKDDISSADAKKVEDKIGTILNVITSIGMLLSVIMPAILGIKYMLGSLEEKAEYKKDMVPYFVGAVLLFGICTIVKILQAFGQNINDI